MNLLTMTRTAACLASVVIAFMALILPAGAASMRDEFRETLSTGERQDFDAYIKAQIFHDAAVDAYWGHVEKLRAMRRAKRRNGRNLEAEDYVQTLPPTYSGPSLPKSLHRRWSAFIESREEKRPPSPSDELPDVEDFLKSAREIYGFVPERVSEREFKKRYAREARALGITGDQVVRVYALETSGLGTADMQAGIHPISKKGKPISTALGYAQLLAANSINELANHGKEFVSRLNQMARREANGSVRQKRFLAKARSLERMTRKARSIPNRWARHVAYSKTAAGRGIHAINLDGDIGPWLQVIKLKGLKKMAAGAGRDKLSGAQIELMNLAGPGTGLEMMNDAGLSAPTPNFFARSAYYRNTIVRGKTSKELLKALDQRMDENLKNSGAIEFREVFRELEASESARR